jgi:dihydroorotase
MKMNPPLREPDDLAAVADGLADGTIDCIATDHAPHTATEKELQFDQAPFGVIGLETAFAAGVTYLVETGKLDLATLVQTLTERPARMLGLSRGRLEEGAEADLVLLDPAAEWRVERAHLGSRSENSCFLGERLQGRVVATFLRGRVAWHQES